MALTEYSIRLQRGIRGGFAPATPNAIFTINKASTNTHLLIASAIRLDGTPSLQDAGTKSLDARETETAALVDELHEILKTIPTEFPPGTEDIYGLDTSIAWLSDDLQWCNLGQEGDGEFKSEVQPTREQEKKFKRAVEIVDELVKRGEAEACAI